MQCGVVCDHVLAVLAEGRRSDLRVPVLRTIHARRLAAYKALGFTRELQTLTTLAA